MSSYLFWVCVAMTALNLFGTWLCVAAGIHCWAGVIMTVFWLFLAWVHGRRIA